MRATIAASWPVVSNRVSLAFGNQGPGDLARASLLAVSPDDIGQVPLVGRRDQVGGRLTGGLVEAHVERSIEPKSKATLGIIKLERRHSEIEQDAVDAINPQLIEVCVPASRNCRG